MVIPLGSWRRGAVLAVVGALTESDYIQSVGLELRFKMCGMLLISESDFGSGHVLPTTKDIEMEEASKSAEIVGSGPFTE